MTNIDPATIKALAISARLKEVAESVHKTLGDSYYPTMREYFPAIREGCKKLKLDPIALASAMGEKIHSENGNPLPFIAACVEFVIEGQPIH